MKKTTPTKKKKVPPQGSPGTFGGWRNPPKEKRPSPAQIKRKKGK
jgi:hypothetical protein